MSHLLVINVQKGFVADGAVHVPARVESLQDSFDEVIVSRFYNPQKSLFRRLLSEERYPLGSSETQLAFQPRPDATIIDYPSYSCVNTTLLERLRRAAVGRVHVCGVATETSVLASVIDLFEAGIEPVVLAHACGSTIGAHMHEAALQILKRLVGPRQVIGS